MSVLDILTTYGDVGLAVLTLGTWVWREYQRNQRLRNSLQQWRRWYRKDMQEAMSMLENQQDAQERQQAQTEALMEEMKS